MASRLNLLFRAAPKQFLEKTVLFTDQLSTPECAAQARDRITHHFDMQPDKFRATIRILSGLHLYTDAPLTGYLVLPGKPAMIPSDDPPFPFVFFPEFTSSRMLIRREGKSWLHIDCEQGLAGIMPGPETQNDSLYVDSFAYWDHITGHLVGRIRATTVLVKEPDRPWTAYMQQIVGTPGHEVVRCLFSQPLRY